ncbi:MAG: bifunctional folylpolyglutamate synthase/dihydrofolate synthase [Polyangiaceae bacterium]|jgi:dihydrofolate synthase / folylpolyglutamate synthase
MSASLARVLGELYARIPLGMRLGLDAMNEACEQAGHPERAYEHVHVAGTNGKGSVCAMVESVARAAGKKTGLYTSPHLVKLAERIRVDGEPLTDDALEDVLARALALRPELSFFETVTLAAFLAFRDAKVDLAVIEVGIGGRLDATNVIPAPRAAAITRIAFDHMDKLGDTLVAIAREKAAIAKPGTTVVIGEMDPAVRTAIDEVVRARSARTVDVATLGPFDAFGQTAPFAGDHQLGNRDVAVGVSRLLGFDDATIAKGLRAARWPGRLERIETADGSYLLDGAHNPDGALALARYLASTASAQAPLAIVFGALADKAWPEMLDILARSTPATTHRVYVEPRGRAATPPSALAARHPGETASDVTDALHRARARVGPHGVVVVCGSLYLVGEARAVLLGLESDPPVAM